MDESVLWVLQGEYGVLPRRSSSPLPALLGTADATTCLIVLLATPHAVGCAHVDSEQTAEALRHVLADMAACRSGPARAAETPVDAWLLGSYSDGADSVANVAGALAALHAAPGFSVALRGVSLCPPLSDASLYDAASCGVAASADSPALLPITRVAAGDRDAGPAWSLVVLPAVPRPGDGFPTAEACRALSDAALLRMSTSPEHEPPSFCPAFRLALAFAAGGDASAVAAFGRLPAGPRVLRPRQAAGGRLEFDS
ncbi:hypothetical protein FNF27_01858 [Cafeteria roenbergensis]|uniref:Uncharacterized protein n=1 Tax=Cafeteria roenbergensis TaxID=33653 RepID=A0A5A8EIW8_CAFRO|nr:hypothetical protein FNF27_01858 [Cafeteria roenbergensis]